MRFKEFILEFKGPQGGRGKFIEREEAISIINSKCKKARDEYLKSGNVIYRGMKQSGDFYSIDPKSSPRRSQYTDNYYTLMLDGDPRWKGFPKRSESLICTTSHHKAIRYGNNTVRVFPYDGANYGVCSEDDIWDSFNYSMGNMMLGELNDGLNWLHDNMGFLKKLKTVKTFKELMFELDRISKRLEREYDLVKEDPEEYDLPHYVRDSELVYRWDKSGDFKDWYLKLFDPTKNGFFHTKDIKKVFSTGKKYKELWTDSKAVMIAEYLVIDKDSFTS